MVCMYAENSNNIQEDGIRVDQIGRTHSRPGHPFRKFNTG